MTVIIAIIKLLAGLFLTLVGLFVAIAIVSGWSEANKQTANSECELRRLDHNIAEDRTGIYHDFCMEAKGYRRLGFCVMTTVITAPSVCYAPKWQFWRI